jgi:hypothetical protein
MSFVESSVGMDKVRTADRILPVQKFKLAGVILLITPVLSVLTQQSYTNLHL